MRQAESQSIRYQSYYNHRYQYDLIPVQHVAPDLATTNTFLVRLRMQGRQILGRRNVSSAGTQSAFWPSDFSISQNPHVQKAIQKAMTYIGYSWLHFQLPSYK